MASATVDATSAQSTWATSVAAPMAPIAVCAAVRIARTMAERVWLGVWPGMRPGILLAAGLAAALVLSGPAVAAGLEELAAEGEGGAWSGDFPPLRSDNDLETAAGMIVDGDLEGSIPVLNGVLAWAMLRKARAVRSIALEGDARHLFTDVWTTAGVVVGLVAVQATGWSWLDPLLAIGVAVNIGREALHLVRRSWDGLMDRALEPEVQQRIEAALDGFRHAQSVQFDHVVTRRAGQRRFVDLHMHMPAGWSLGRAAALRTSVEQALMSEVPGLRATIQLLPIGVETHFHDLDDTP